MTTQIGNDLLLALPEIVLALAALSLLLTGTFFGRAKAGSLLWICVVAIAFAALYIVFTFSTREIAFNGLFVVEPFGNFMKLLVLLGAGLAMVLSYDFMQRERMALFEFPVLLLLATLGMVLMVSSNDLISLYMGLELQSLALYVVAAIRRDSLKSSEAGLKYFVLGALSSGMLLYGASMIYGFAGTTSFNGLGQVFTQMSAMGEMPELGLIVGLVFLLAGLCFKISAVPFHMWTPDVYEGAPTAVTAFFAAAPKVAAFALLMRVLLDPFIGLLVQWQQIIVAVSILSMVLGAFAAIGQANIKRLMAYSSIGHVGYALVGLAAGTEDAAVSVMVYLAIYLVMTLGTFACILTMRRDGRLVEGIDDLRGLFSTQPMLAVALSILMFSLAGIPPLAGFIAKLYVFEAAVRAGLYTLTVIGVLSSAVAAFYYLRIVKLMWFDEAGSPLDKKMPREVGLVIATTSLAMVVLVAIPDPLTSGAAAAAASLFGK
ncbi:MAG: NADH-quinone oxidoreductase subunit NuoN [Rhodospirillales bacterium]|nr:NADH-quinone oxidoreductase subunit NuoN [Rhodospirillales bacterium]